ncbi:unnamed protein product [Gordionus sp. m RMFG-2023]|uniref:solute carrier family 35 member F2-like n=1 Tax=Gordionus sp. m RMFG-2023 TaxID=3053472 RepID=UPI0030E57ECE
MSLLSTSREYLTSKTKKKFFFIDYDKIVDTIKSRSLWESVLLGQLISILICTTGVTSEVLASVYHVHIPTAQNFFNYLVLALVFNACLYFKRRNVISSRYSSYTKYYYFEILKNRGIKYFVLALIDVEANYLIVKAYQYTTLTSIQLLDCLIIPVVMLLSVLFLKARYRVSHFLGVFICVLGVGFLIYSDRQQRITTTTAQALNIQQDTFGNNKFLGDMLCLVAAILYGLSNVGQEFFVKRFDKYEFLALLGTFATLINGVQFLILERSEIKISHFINSNLKTSYPILLVFLFSLAMFGLYFCMATALNRTSALAVNLSILSADFYTLFLGVFLFHFKFNALFLLAFLLIINGVVIYNLAPSQPTSDSVQTNTNDSSNMPQPNEAAELKDSSTNINGFTNGKVSILDKSKPFRNASDDNAFITNHFEDGAKDAFAISIDPQSNFANDNFDPETNLVPTNK